MNIIIIKIFILFVSNFFSSFLTCVEAVEGIIVWQDMYRVETFKCLKEKLSIEFIIVSAAYYKSSEYKQVKINKNTSLNILNARAAGIEDVDIYIPSCLSCNQSSESIIKVLNHLNENNTTFGTFWFSVYGLNSCSSTKGCLKNEKAKNVKFINEMVTTLINNNQTYGIYTNKCEWHEITGNTQIFNNSSLLYEHIDLDNNFDDYNEYGYPFGGWDKPKMKEYLPEYVCGIDVARVWRP